MNKPFPAPRVARNQTARPEFLDAPTEARLARCWRDEGDVADRNRLITSHQALAIAAAKRAGGKGRELDSDTLQHANIELLKAADRFEPDKGFHFFNLCRMVDQGGNPRLQDPELIPGQVSEFNGHP